MSLRTAGICSKLQNIPRGCNFPRTFHDIGNPKDFTWWSSTTMIKRVVSSNSDNFDLSSVHILFCKISINLCIIICLHHSNKQNRNCDHRSCKVYIAQNGTQRILSGMLTTWPTPDHGSRRSPRYLTLNSSPCISFKSVRRYRQNQRNVIIIFQLWYQKLLTLIWKLCHIQLWFVVQNNFIGNQIYHVLCSEWFQRTSSLSSDNYVTNLGMSKYGLWWWLGSL